MPRIAFTLATFVFAFALGCQSAYKYADVEQRPSAIPASVHSPRAHGVITSFETGARLPSIDVTFYGWQFRTTLRTDSAGAYRLDSLPEYKEIFFRVKCPIPGRADTVAGPFVMSMPGMDTTLNLGVQFRGCTHLDRRHPLIAGPQPNETPRHSSEIDPEIAGVYRGILDSFYPPSRPSRGLILLRPSTVRDCVYCVESEVPRLIRQGLLDPSTEANFSAVGVDTVPKLFSYRLAVDTMPTWDIYWLAESGKVEWGAMKDAYPGVNATFSFLRVGFSNDRRQALAEIYVDSAGAEFEPETMLLEKRGSDWRVSQRHLERDATSGEWAGGKCAPTDAPVHPPSRAQIQQLSGDYKIIRVGASKGIRGRTDTLRVRLDRLRPDAKKPDRLAAKASVIDGRGQADSRIAVKFETAGDTPTITLTERLPEGRVMLDGWIEWHKILKIDGDRFSGSWFTETGPTVPLTGYFCAQR